MDQVTGIFCKLCLNSIIDRKFQVSGDAALEVLSVLSLNVNLNEKDSYMCNDCSVNLFAAYDFKIMCLDTESSLVPYIDFENASYIDLRDIYLKVKGGGNVTVTSNQQICRLCMCIMDDGFMSLEELSVANMVNRYIPEVNFSITKDPVVCKHCWNTLGTHIDCLSKWTNIKKEIKIESEDPDDYVCVKSEDIDLKVEEHNGDGYNISLHELNEEILKGVHTSHSSGSYGVQDICPVRNLNYSGATSGNGDGGTDCKSDSVVSQVGGKGSSKGRTHKDSPEIKMYECDKCDFQSKWRTTLARHRTKHADPSEIQTYNCEQCAFRTVWKHGLLKHQLQHKDPSEVQMHKCDKCDYQNKNKRNLVRHQIRHRDPSEVKKYKCDKCAYQSDWKRHLVRHQIIHGDPSETETYNCDECDYQTIWKYNLALHQLKHRNPSEVQMYKCEQCDFQTKHKSNIATHRRMQHSDPSKLKMYECEECGYQTKCKSNLVIHQKIHADPSEVRTYNCDKCPYQTIRKNNLLKHQLRHKDYSEVKMYKCGECDFQTKHKGSLAIYQLQHKDPLEVQMYKCDQCDYQAKQKGSITQHQLLHRDPSEVKKYKCDQCDYESIWNSHVVRHRKRIHGDL